GGNKVEIYNNVAGDGALLLVRGPFRDGVYVERNLSNGTSGKLVQLKPDATFTTSGTTFQGGNFYSPFGLDADRARTFFSRGAIATNCSNQSYTAWW
ncbi:MAG: hypothetical protein KTR31_11490, partial [Myxococcales bacterium]|nr:hypothetical protein [Myxococcales bacterium]